MELTETERRWQDRLILLAGEASDDDLPCVQNTLLALVRMLELPRYKQLMFAGLITRQVELAH